MTHKLKTWPEYFARISNGDKTFEVRKNDRDFQTGDVLWLKEFDPKTGTYTGNELTTTVTYILHGGKFGIEQDTVVMGFTPFTND